MNKVLLRDLVSLTKSTPISELPNIINDNNKYIIDVIKEFYDNKRIYTGDKYILAPIFNNIVSSKTGKFVNLQATNLAIENVEFIEPSTKLPFGTSDIVLKRHLDTDKLDYVNGKLTVIDKSDSLKCPIDADNYGNVFIGVNASVPTNKSNMDNIVLGNDQTLCKLTESNVGNITIGHNSLSKLTDGSNNIIIGHNSATSVHVGNGNIVIGQEITLEGTETISDKFIVGSGINPDFIFGDITLGTFGFNSIDAKLFFKNDINIYSTNQKNIIIGGNDIMLLNHTNGTDNVFIGNDVSANVASGNNNIFIGKSAGFRYSGVVNNMLAIGIVDIKNNILNPIIEANLATNVLKLNASTVDIAGDIRFTKAMRTSGGGTVVGVDKNNNLVKFTSSKRYKKDVNTLECKDSKQIYDIDCVTYKPKDGDDNTYYGFIAEDVAAVDDKLVGYTTIDGVSVVDSVMYDRFVVLLLNEIKQHEKTIQALNEKVSNLEKIIR
ncbi:MAG: tail fiber domain-containing protein [Bacteroidales bacterium]